MLHAINLFFYLNAKHLDLHIFDLKDQAFHSSSSLWILIHQ